MPIGISAIAVGRGALDELPGLADIPASGSAVVMTDAVPKSRGGEDVLEEVEARLERSLLRRVVVGQAAERVHADELTIAQCIEQVSGASLLVTVGSGTLADIGKAVSARLGGVRHVVVQTATSVNGFADDQSVLLIDGVKRTTPTRWPDALIADSLILTGAPVGLNLAGVGDLLAMFTAPADWRLASLLLMVDEYLPATVGLVRKHGDRLLSLAPRLASRDEEAATGVAEILALSGISMGVAGTTAPASGMEHTVSHLIEMTMNSRGADSAYHGAQVGVCTIVASVLWSRIVAQLRAAQPPDLRFPTEDEMEGRVMAAFAPLDSAGAMGRECWRLYAKKLRRWNANRAALLEVDWSAFEASLTDLLGRPAELAASLVAAGAPTRFSQLDPPVDEELVRWALEQCHLMRDRFTIADLAFLTGGWDADAVDEVLDAATAAGGGP